MRKFLLFIVLLGVIGGGGYYLYRMQQKAAISVENIVPADAVLFYASPGLKADWRQLQASAVGKQLRAMAPIDSAWKTAEQFFNLEGSADFPICFSVHKTGKSDVDFVFYLQESDAKEMLYAFEEHAKNNNWLHTQRKLDGIDILDYTEAGKRLFSTCRRANWVVFSTSPFLVEEVIKTNLSPDWVAQPAMWVLFPQRFADFAKVYLSEYDFGDMIQLGTAPIAFELAYYDEGLAFSGIATATGTATAKEAATLSRNLIPMNVARLMVNTDHQLLTTNKGEQYKIFPRASAPDYVLVDTLYVDGQEFPVLRMRATDSTASLPFGIAVQFEEKLLAAATLELLEKACKSFVSEDVWGKSLRINHFLDNTNTTVQQGVYLQFKEYQPLLEQQLSDPIKTEYAANKKQLSFIDYIAVERQDQANQQLFSGFLAVSSSGESAPVAATVEAPASKEQVLYIHDMSIISQPFVMKNHQTSEMELLFQDQSNALCLVSQAGKLLWKHALNGPIKGKVYQVDAYRNGRLQYAFCTDKQLHLVDRNGNNVQGFPRDLSQSIHSFTVFDYDKNRQYRFVAALTNGDILFCDAQAQWVAPWNPKKGKSALIGDVQHFRENGKDYIVAMTADGLLHLYNRRGEYYPGFPMDAGLAEPVSYYIAQGSSKDSRLVVMASAAGRTKSLTPKGEIVDQVTLPVAAGDQLQLVAGNEEMLYAIRDAASVAYVNTKGDLLFEVNEQAKYTQLYNFSAQHDLIAAGTGTNTSLYALNGQRKAVFASSNYISCLYSSAKESLTVYTVSDKEISKWIFNDKNR